MTRTAKLLLLPLLVLQVAFFSYIALHHFVDGDEGFYLLASRLVLMHKKPYLDFFYTQAPLLPYVYALWLKLTSVTWVSGKLFAALLTAVLGTLVFADVCRQTRNWVAGLAAVVMFCVSTLIFAFFPVVKTYSLAGLFLFAAYFLAGRISGTSPRWLMGASGLLLGLSADTRSYLVLVAAVFLWWIYRNSETRARVVLICWFLGGMAIGLLPCLYFFVSSPSAFLFNNLGYHAARSGSGLVGMWQEKLAAILVTFLGGSEGNGLQTSLLFFVSVAFVFSIHKPRYAPRFAFQIALTVGLISLLPTPVHPQYFCLCIPFLLSSTVCVVNGMLMELSPGRGKLTTIAACAAVLGLYVASSVGDFRRFLVTGDRVPGVDIGLDKNDWRLQRVLAVSQAIDQIARPGEPVASFWPGYIFQSKAVPFSGFESDFGLSVSEKLTPEQRARYHIVSPADLQAEFSARVPRIVVLTDKDPTPTKVEFWRNMIGVENSLGNTLREHGYTLVKSIGDTSIYAR